MKVLVVDDDQCTRNILTDLLEYESIEALATHNGKNAVAIASECPELDCILMDYQMPVMNGVEAIKQIRAMRHLDHARIYLMSAKWSAHSLADELGVEFIRKPFSLVELLKRIRVKSSYKMGA